VIIGRFQVAELHEGHRSLIDNVLSRHRKVVIILGISPLANSINNPLDFEARKQMLCSAYPSVTVLYVRDVNNDDVWSRTVDSTIGTVLGPTQTALLYGSRDSFIKHYNGRFDTYELPSEHVKPGTAYREEIGRAAKDSADWRAGVIWASRNRYPTSYQTVDIAVFSPDYSQVLLGKRDNEEGWRLIGGFADPASLSLEDDARREAMEEANIRLDNLSYIRSFMIDDWRYRNEPDCIKTALFIATTSTENPKAGDDVDHVCWFDRNELDPTASRRIMADHRELVTHALMRSTHILTTKERK
jgi:bifunctional NMN adenylyltransferase/nudix hydrolase